MRIHGLAFSLIIAAVIIAGCTQPAAIQPPQTIPATPSTVPVQTLATPVPTPISQAPVSANTITIKNFAFDPQTLTVNAGSTVRWVNYDSVTHRIVFIDSAGRDTDVDSSVLSSSQSWSYRFDTPGTYDYYCKIHSEMKGKIIVV
jgi:amicyanin